MNKTTDLGWTYDPNKGAWYDTQQPDNQVDIRPTISTGKYGQLSVSHKIEKGGLGLRAVGKKHKIKDLRKRRSLKKRKHTKKRRSSKKRN